MSLSMPNPPINEIHDCADLRKACTSINDVPEYERDHVKHALMQKSVELDCPDAIPDDWRIRIGKEYE